MAANYPDFDVTPRATVRVETHGEVMCEITGDALTIDVPDDMACSHDPDESAVGTVDAWLDARGKLHYATRTESWSRCRVPFR